MLEFDHLEIADYLGGVLSVWFWSQDSVEYEIFKQYERALVAIGVNFSLEEVQISLEGCTYGLEDAISCTIDYLLWLQKNDLQFFPNAILIRALQEQWKPKAWRDEYLELPMLESPGQRWWVAIALRLALSGSIIVVTPCEVLSFVDDVLSLSTITLLHPYVFTPNLFQKSNIAWSKALQWQTKRTYPQISIGD